jgi:short subunit dehydrogenase-like uncharacterized protein
MLNDELVCFTSCDHLRKHTQYFPSTVVLGVEDSHLFTDSRTMVDILLIGATGFCGRHAARYVLEHPERSKFTVGLAARSRTKLLSIGLPIDDSVQIFELDILDALAVENAVKKAKVVLNCIGPFWHYGSPVVQ